MNPLPLYRLSRWLWLRRVPFLPRLVSRLLFFLCSCDIPPECALGRDVIMPHYGIGVVIHRNAIIGDRVKIFHNVTIGRRQGPDDDMRSRITIEVGDDCVIGAGAKVLAAGDLRIGARSFIGANAVVLSDVPADSVAVGVPARIRPASRSEHPDTNVGKAA